MNWKHNALAHDLAEHLRQNTARIKEFKQSYVTYLL